MKKNHVIHRLMVRGNYPQFIKTVFCHLSPALSTLLYLARRDLKRGGRCGRTMRDFMARYGVVGHSIAYSRSPSIHNLWMTSYGIFETYSLWDIPPLTAPSFLKAFIDSGGRGLNITTPFKRDFFNLLSCVDELGTLAQAVNTIKITQKGEVFGYNTDVQALIDLLQVCAPDCSSRFCQSAVVLGGGGVMAGSLAALSKIPCQNVSLFSRSSAVVPPALQNCFAQVDFYPWCFNQPVAKQALEDADVVIHAVPCHRDDLDILINLMAPFSTLVIWSYTDSLDFLKERAALKKIRVIDGLTLLHQQARHSFYHWFGLFPFMPCRGDSGQEDSMGGGVLL